MPRQGVTMVDVELAMDELWAIEGDVVEFDGGVSAYEYLCWSLSLHSCGSSGGGQEDGEDAADGVEKDEDGGTHRDDGAEDHDEDDLDATVADLQAENDANFAIILPEQLRPLPGLLDLLDALESAQIPKIAPK